MTGAYQSEAVWCSTQDTSFDLMGVGYYPSVGDTVSVFYVSPLRWFFFIRLLTLNTISTFSYVYLGMITILVVVVVVVVVVVEVVVIVEVESRYSLNLSGITQII